MNKLVLASSAAEAAASEEVSTRLAEAIGTLGTLTNNVLAAAANPGSVLTEADQGKLVDFAEQELLPLAAAFASAFQAGSFAQGSTTNSSDRSGTPELAAIASTHNERITTAAKLLEAAENPVAMVHASGRLQEAATAFVDDTTNMVLPALARNTSVELSSLLPARSRGAADSETHVPASGGCACGGHDEPGLAELDTRVIPHAIRHATIFGALEGLNPGKGILLVANHNPLPLLAQLEQRSPGKFAVDYLENGPETWKLSMIRN